MRRLALAGTAGLAALVVIATAAAPAGATTALSPTDQRVHDVLTTRVVDRYIGRYVAGQVVDAGTSREIWSLRRSTQMLPASTLKLTTAVAALQAAGPGFRFHTTVRRGASWAAVALVGDGDPLLSSGTVSVMAQTTATALRARGRRSVDVYVDASLFPAPTSAAGWTSGYVPGQAHPVSALTVDERAVLDPAMDAGAIFVAKLKLHGIAARLVGRGHARSGLLIAQSTSATLSSTVTRMLQRSDNDIAEALFRLPPRIQHLYPTWTNAQLARRRILNALGVSTTGSVLVDGSGLSRSDRISTAQLVAVLQAARRTTEFPRLYVITHGALPVAGAASGSLAASLGRYNTAPTSCAAYKLVGKTGSLHDVVALAGYAQGADGRVKTYAFLVNGLSSVSLANKRAVDKLSSSITGCW
jgi:serine-type D-Ala-D-Ala carboxypeptidase/endopeptidase (penicillin-binding protein 4)